MTLFARFLLISAFALLLSGPATAELSPQAILEQCDQARGNLEGVSWTVSVEATEGKHQSYRRMQVQSRGFDTLAETIAPPQQKGHLLLMVKGSMWFYKPDISKPVPISQRQKLLGLAANGDIASTNYARDYEILRQQETLLDGEPCHLFDLAARSQNTTYARVRYWVTKQPLVGVKAEFFSTGGDKLLKSARMSYENRIGTTAGQRPFISRMVIRDELLSENTTILTFSNPVLKPIPDHVFNLNLLRK